MRILYIAHNTADASKGAANADLSLLAAMSHRGHEVEQVWNVGEPRKIRHDNLHLLLEAPRKCEAEVIQRLANAEYDVILTNQPLSWRAARAVRRLGRATLFVARSHGWEPRVFEEQRSFLTADRRGQIRQVASNALRPWLHRQNRLLLRWANGVVVCSRDDRDYLLTTGGVSSDRILALAPGLPEEFLRSAPPSLSVERCHRILYVGQFALFKAPEVVASVMTEVLTQRPNVLASWVCAASDHPKVAALLPESVRQRVTLLDWMPRAELLKVYDSHGIYLFPSLFEGFAQTFLEAMARGMAVLATRIDGMAQAIQDGENGFLFDRGQRTEMAKLAIELLDGRADVIRIGRGARKTATAYTWSRAAETLEEFFHGLKNLTTQ